MEAANRKGVANPSKTSAKMLDEAEMAMLLIEENEGR
jgi:hypothetical protein